MKSFTELAHMALRNPDNRTVDVLIGEAVDLMAYEDVGIRNSLRMTSLEDLAEKADQQQIIWSSLLPRYTSSYDAIMTLVVPDAEVRIEHGTYRDGTGSGWAYVHMISEAGEMTGEAQADTELSALLAAMLFARACQPDFIRAPDAVAVGGVHA
jgi:hypothetical protein